MKRLLLASALFVLVAGPGHAASIFSEDFEADDYGLGAGLLNWSVTSGSIDVIGGPFYGFYGAGKYLDMNGSTGQGGRIESNTMRFSVGQQYRLTFDYGNNQYSNGAEELSFGIGSATGSIAINGYVPNLIRHSFTFFATSDMASIFFADTGTTGGDNGGPILDNINISAVPVPAGAPLLIGALGGLAALRRRRKAGAA
jgi:hypothetical protein